MNQKLPLLIQEKLDFYVWFHRQKEVIKGYHVKCHVGSYNIGEILYIYIDKWNHHWLSIPMYENSVYPVYKLYGCKEAYITDWASSCYKLSKYYHYTSAMNHPTAFRMK